MRLLLSLVVFSSVSFADGAANHTLICTGDQGHEWLRYDARQFENFEYPVEWRFTLVTTPNPKYNSGIFFRNDKDGTIWRQAQFSSEGDFDVPQGYLGLESEEYLIKFRNIRVKPLP